MCRIGAPGGEGEVVGVARVGPAMSGGESGESMVELTGAEIAQCRTGAGTLRQGARAGGDVEGLVVVGDRTARALGADQGEDGGDGGRVAELLEDATHAWEGDAGKEVLQVGIQHDVLPGMGAGVGDCAAPWDESVGHTGQRDGQEDVLVNPALRGGEIAMRGGQLPDATAFLRHLKADVVRDCSHLRMKGEPAEPTDGESHGLREFRRGGKHWEPGCLELFDMGAAISEAAGDSAPQEDDVGLVPMGDVCGALPFLFGGFLLLQLLQRGAGFFIESDGGLPTLMGGVQSGAEFIHLEADLVDLGQLLGSDEPFTNHGAVDDEGARISGRRDDAGAAKGPEIVPAKGTAGGLRLLCGLGGGDGGKEVTIQRGEPLWLGARRGAACGCAAGQRRRLIVAWARGGPWCGRAGFAAKEGLQDAEDHAVI